MAATKIDKLIRSYAGMRDRIRNDLRSGKIENANAGDAVARAVDSLSEAIRVLEMSARVSP